MKFLKLLLMVVTMSFLGCSYKEPNLNTKVKELKASLNSEESGDISVTLEDNNSTINISFQNDILFELGKYKIKPKFEKKLAQVSNFLIKNPKFGVLVEGHTDSTGEADYNQKLSEKRANAVKELFLSFNISEDRILTIGYGEEQPKYSNDSEENRKKNRRAEIKLKENIQELIKGKQFIGQTVIWDYNREVKGGLCVGFFLMEFCSDTRYYTFKYKGIVRGVNDKGDCVIKIIDIDGLNQLSAKQRSMINLESNIGKTVTKNPSSLTKVYY